MSNKKIVLKEDYIIPKGTVFKNCDNKITQFVDGNYEALISVNKDNVMSIHINEEDIDKGKFKIVE